MEASLPPIQAKGRYTDIPANQNQTGCGTMMRLINPNDIKIAPTINAYSVAFSFTMIPATNPPASEPMAQARMIKR